MTCKRAADNIKKSILPQAGSERPVTCRNRKVVSKSQRGSITKYSRNLRNSTLAKTGDMTRLISSMAISPAAMTSA